MSNIQGFQEQNLLNREVSRPGELTRRLFLCQKNGLLGLKGPSTGTVKKCEKPKDFHGGGTNEE